MGVGQLTFLPLGHFARDMKHIHSPHSWKVSVNYRQKVGSHDGTGLSYVGHRGRHPRMPVQAAVTTDWLGVGSGQSAGL